jgi:hypothetical protein
LDVQVSEDPFDVFRVYLNEVLPANYVDANILERSEGAKKLDLGLRVSSFTIVPSN